MDVVDQPLKIECRGCILTAHVKEVEGGWKCSATLEFPSQTYIPKLIAEDGPYTSADEAVNAAKRWAFAQVDQLLPEEQD